MKNQEDKQERFYAWMKKIGSIHQASKTAMGNAAEKITR